MSMDGPISIRSEVGCKLIHIGCHFLFDQIWEAYVNKDDSHDDDIHVSDGNTVLKLVGCNSLVAFDRSCLYNIQNLIKIKNSW